VITIHDIINGTAVSFGGNINIIEMRKVLMRYAQTLKDQFLPTAIVCNTNDSLVISKKTANTAERACDWLAHSDDVSDERVAELERAQTELWGALENAFNGETRMGTEKMDKCDGFGTTEGDYVYPTCGESIGGCVSNCHTIGSATPTLKPQTFAEIHASRVIDELWRTYGSEHDREAQFEILRAITNAVTVLHMVRGNKA
jgi:hypothetical protein